MSGQHIVVIGAGITGSLVAQELQSRGFAVTVLEAREKGAGSSSRSAACIRQQWSTPATVQAMLYSVRAYGRFGETMRCASGDCDLLVQNGYLFLYDRPELTDDAALHAARWQGALRNVAMQRSVGLAEVELLRPGEVAERFGHIDADRLIGATFCPTDGFLRPDVVYLQAFRRFAELGGVLHQNDPVLDGIFATTGELVGVRTASGREVRGDLFINATNAWAPRLSRRLGGRDLPIAPLKRYLYFVHRAGVDSSAMLDWPMTITPSRAYCRPENGDQLLAGWAHATEAEPEFDHSDQDLIEARFFHKTGLENYGFELWFELAQASAGIGGFAGIQATTAGYYAVTPDHSPILGFDPIQPRLFHAAGFSGHGAMMGPFTAQATAAMVAAGRTLPEIELDGVTIDLRATAVERRFAEAEGMVI
jgi:sarcosine oxidase, subunit beta